jgi:hypothetical protein
MDKCRGNIGSLFLCLSVRKNSFSLEKICENFFLEALQNKKKIFQPLLKKFLQKRAEGL